MATMSRVAGVLSVVGLASGARVRLDRVAQLKAANTASEAALNLADHLPLCANEIVQETCQGAFDVEDGGVVTPAALEELLSATSASVATLWGVLGLEGDAATCTQLCEGAVKALQEMQAAPPASDVACYLDGPSHAHITVCDVDVRPETIKQDTEDEEDLPDFHDNKKQQLLKHAANLTGDALVERPDYNDPIEYPVKVAIRRTANLFRIYPATLSTVDEEADDEEVQAIEGASSLAEKVPSDWKRKIQRVSSKAIAYVQTALRKFKKRDTEKYMTRWYGYDAYTDKKTRKRLLSILNGVDDMLGNVEYALGPECDSTTYAYVYPDAYRCKSSQLQTRECTKNTKGQFIFYICPLTLRSKLSVQIETLTHEGSHHATAYTDDVDFRGGTAYGRSTCRDLAKKKPSKAIENADNFCYYVQDVTDK